MYEARSLYHRFVRTAYWDENSGCSAQRPEERNGRAVNSSNSVFLVFPNPATDMLQIVPGFNLEAEAKFELFNLFGERVIDTRMPEGYEGVSVVTSTLPAGVYLYKIALQGKSIQSGKVVIAH